MSISDPFGFKPARGNPFGISPINIGGSLGKSRSRSLGIRDKQILYTRAKGKCEACKKKIEFPEMQSGHKKAFSKNGATTLANSVCLCYRCNKLQGTDSFTTLLKKLDGTFGTRVRGEGGKLKPKSKPKRKERDLFGNPISNTKGPFGW